LKLKYYIII